MAMVWPWRSRGYARLRTRRHRAAERDELLEGSEKVPRRFLEAHSRSWRARLGSEAQRETLSAEGDSPSRCAKFAHSSR